MNDGVSRVWVLAVRLALEMVVLLLLEPDPPEVPLVSPLSTAEKPTAQFVSLAATPPKNLERSMKKLYQLPLLPSIIAAFMK